MAQTIAVAESINESTVYILKKIKLPLSVLGEYHIQYPQALQIF